MEYTQERCLQTLIQGATTHTKRRKHTQGSLKLMGKVHPSKKPCVPCAAQAQRNFTAHGPLM